MKQFGICENWLTSEESAVRLAEVAPVSKGTDMTGGSATIVFHRKLSWASAALRLAVCVDDLEVAKLGIGKTVAIDVSPGSHVVKVMYSNREVKYSNRAGSLPVAVGPHETLPVNLRTNAQPFKVELTADEPVKSQEVGGGS
jgi:hypothetical protein